MSTPELPDRVLPTADRGVVPLAATVSHLLAAAVQAAAFWVAAVLPFAYVPMLATGAVGDHPLAFVCLLALNAVGLVVGRGYKRA